MDTALGISKASEGDSKHISRGRMASAPIDAIRQAAPGASFTPFRAPLEARAAPNPRFLARPGPAGSVRAESLPERSATARDGSGEVTPVI